MVKCSQLGEGPRKNMEIFNGICHEGKGGLACHILFFKKVKSVPYKYDSIAKENKWGKKWMEISAIMGWGAPSLKGTCH